MFTTTNQKTLGKLFQFLKIIFLVVFLPISTITHVAAQTTSNPSSNTTNGPWVSFERLADLIDRSTLPKDATIQVELNRTEPRLNSDRCPAAIFSNSRGNRLWGRTFLEVQCLGTDQAPFFIGVEFKIWASVLVAKQAIQPNDSVQENDVEPRSVNLSELANGWITDLTRLNNKIATRQILPGTLLRQDYFKGQPLIKVGETVKITIKGQGFQIAGSGIAMQTAERGDTIRIKTPQGKVLNGMAIDTLLVEVNL